MDYYLAPSLFNCRNEINDRYPNRDKTSDGWIGDKEHQGTVSDHNPNIRFSVNALDIDKDGVDPHFLIRQFLKHPSTNYVIFNGVIWSRLYNFEPRKYTGSNPHIGHIHLSILQTVAAEQNQTPWGIADGSSKMQLPRLNDKGEHVEYWQRFLVRAGFDIGKDNEGNWLYDGHYGTKTQQAVAKSRDFFSPGIDKGKAAPTRITPWNGMMIQIYAMQRVIGPAISATQVNNMLNSALAGYDKMLIEKVRGVVLENADFLRGPAGELPENLIVEGTLRLIR